ncbi:hypothetical protein I302_108828 [Kwoniella bestiolae CBS 10118]|uniref:Dienelactone hydrolase domain-containing protein n=1 Tax=Kwoniella bestiolae CBS 10118 TaxID=1296100 RepID=A0A1B9FU72_9TREE|nr:hypothetical protein I302_07967 [Kwoniella bestiolae CBS 10118]OCF22320.1 hypothetical protein I302_07967 [Kwoniella bestiolae CBS 10118]
MSFIPLSPCCLTGAKLTGMPRGVFQPAVEGQRKVARYHAKPSDGEVVDGKVALVFLTDAFGLSLPNPKIMADAFADQLKINVFVPEYIINPPPAEVFDSVAPIYPNQFPNRSFFAGLKLFIEVLWKTWRWLPMLLFPKRQVPLAQSSINDLTSEGYTSLALVGYCRGGSMIQYLLSNPANTTLVGGVICHPGAEKETWGKIDRPTWWHMADHDQMFGQKAIDGMREVFGKKREDEGVDFECVVHKDTVHGFACRPTLDHEPTKTAFEEANTSAVRFCKKYLLGEFED